MAKQFVILNLIGGIVQNRKPVTVLFQSLKDGRYQLEVSPVDKRSNQQNRYYWQIMTEYFQPGLLNIGWQHIKTKDDAHFFMADIFLRVKETNQETGEVKERTRSTTELTKQEFNVYLNELWQWAAEWLHVAIPSPGESLMIEYD